MGGGKAKRTGKILWVIITFITHCNHRNGVGCNWDGTPHILCGGSGSGYNPHTGQGHITATAHLVGDRAICPHIQTAKNRSGIIGEPQGTGSTLGSIIANGKVIDIGGAVDITEGL